MKSIQLYKTNKEQMMELSSIIENNLSIEHWACAIECHPVQS